MEAVPRTAFVAERHAALAFKDIALPGERGTSVPEPELVARLLAGSRLEPQHRVLLVGLGAGYTAAILSHLVREVLALDRIPSLVAAAVQRFAAVGRTNVAVACADGLAPTEGAPFDRILLVGAIDRPPEAVWTRLKPGGAIIHARNDGPHMVGPQFLLRVEKQSDGIGRQAVLGPSRLAELRRGVVRADS